MYQSWERGHSFREAIQSQQRNTDDLPSQRELYTIQWRRYLTPCLSRSDLLDSSRRQEADCLRDRLSSLFLESSSQSYERFEDSSKKRSEICPFSKLIIFESLAFEVGESLSIARRCSPLLFPRRQRWSDKMNCAYEAKGV